MLLYIARHAKSSQSKRHHKLADHARPLNERGQRDAPRMAAYLASIGARPDLLIASDSVRTVSTAAHLAAGLGLDPAATRLDHRLYLADADTLLSAVRALPAECHAVMLVGHNPGVSDLLRRLSGASDTPELPTMAVATLNLPVAQWTDVSAGCATLLSCHAPKLLPDAASTS